VLNRKLITFNSRTNHSRDVVHQLKKLHLMMKFKSMFIIGLILLNASCDIFPEKIEYDDTELKPYLKAIAQIDRKSMGFTEIEKDADISLERNSKSEKGYDRMLHIYGSTS
jgi:hypothetical protein